MERHRPLIAKRCKESTLYTVLQPCVFYKVVMTETTWTCNITQSLLQGCKQPFKNIASSMEGLGLHVVIRRV